MPYANAKVLRVAAITAALTAILGLGACGGGPLTPTLPAVSITLAGSFPGGGEFTPAQQITPAQAVIVTATVIDPNSQGVTWTITPINFGTLSAPISTGQGSSSQNTSSVTYTAPVNVPAAATVTLTATSITNPTISVAFPIKVAPIFVSLQVTNEATGSTSLAVDQTINQGDQLGLTAFTTAVLGVSKGVTWAISPTTGAGSLTGETTQLATYVAPATVTSPVTATITATSILNSGSSASLQVTVLQSGAAPNVTAVRVNGGPVPTQAYANGAFTSVTLCNPGSTTVCTTVEGVLVDTGSSGLRILQSEIPLLKLPTFQDLNGNTLENCAPNVDGSYLWGPVAQADVYIASEFASASAIPGENVQVITSSNATAVPDGCSNGGTNLNTAQLLGANGILGVGPEPTDCTLAGVNLCDGSTTGTIPNLYYSCPSTGCLTSDSPVTVAAGSSSVAGNQVTNPAARFVNQISFSNDNNGVVLQLAAVSGTEPSLVGTLTFGIGTETNNQLGNATVLDLDSNDHFTTIFGGQTLTGSFLDSGSNALFFPDNLPVCSTSSQYFCPTSLTNLSAENKGATQGDSTVPFTVDNADNLFATYPGDAVFDNLAGPEGIFQSCSDGMGSCTFDWGLPFFYGRTVFTKIDSCVFLPPPATNTCTLPQAPYYAY